jgi:hypothetical protein
MAEQSADDERGTQTPVEPGAEGDWKRSGEDPEIGTRDVDDDNRLHISRVVPDDPDEGRLNLGDTVDKD